MDIPRLSPKEALALDLLITHGEMYGLQMVEESSELKRGTVYVLLARMADKGYVDSRQVKVEGSAGMPKRMFRATGLGQRMLHAWRMADAVLAAEMV